MKWYVFWHHFCKFWHHNTSRCCVSLWHVQILTPSSRCHEFWSKYKFTTLQTNSCSLMYVWHVQSHLVGRILKSMYFFIRGGLGPSPFPNAQTHSLFILWSRRIRSDLSCQAHTQTHYHTTFSPALGRKGVVGKKSGIDSPSPPPVRTSLWLRVSGTHIRAVLYPLLRWWTMATRHGRSTLWAFFARRVNDTVLCSWCPALRQDIKQNCERFRGSCVREDG